MSAFQLFAKATFAASAALALAAASTPPKLKVHFRTCTKPGVEKGCVVALSGGRLYDVTGINPSIGPNEYIQGVGEVADAASICQQGMVIGQFVPDPDQPQVRCPNTPPKARRG